jgi:hypothetical protein
MESKVSVYVIHAHFLVLISMIAVLTIGHAFFGMRLEKSNSEVGNKQ